MWRSSSDSILNINTARKRRCESSGGSKIAKPCFFLSFFYNWVDGIAYELLAVLYTLSICLINLETEIEYMLMNTTQATSQRPSLMSFLFLLLRSNLLDSG